MKPVWAIALLPLIGACGSASSEVSFGQDPSADGGANPDGGTADAGPVVPPTELVPTSAAVVGITSTNWVIYRDSSTLGAVPLEVDAQSELVSDNPGNVLIRGQVVFNFADVDWTTNMGELSVWTPDGGAHAVGPSLYAEALVAASQDGSTVVYTVNPTQDTADLIIAPSDLSSPVVLIPAMGRGSGTTCAPSLGFVGDSLFIGWCTVGSLSGQIERYDRIDGHWEPTLIAKDALPNWSADANGKRIFFQSSQYEGYFSEGGDKTLVDKGIGEALMLPDGSAVLYNVGDQYRRSSLPNVNPVPIVVTKYAARAALSPSYDWLLYSTTVTYTQGTRRDLLLAKTDGYNATPNVVVPEPVAGLGRAAFSSDGKWVLYLTDITPTGATLVIQAVDGGEPRKVPHVVEVAAARGSTIVLSANQTDIEKYPVLADLLVMNLETDTEPKMLEPKTVDARGFQLDENGDFVVYTRSDPDGAGPKTEALLFRSVP